MANLSDFLKIPKIDNFNNLQAGMRYSSYSRWSGFTIPGFPEDGVCYDSGLKEDFRFYTGIKINSRKDIQNLLYMSISEAAADNVKIIYGGIALELCEKCENPSDFINAVEEVKSKYAETIKINPVLIINSDVNCNLFLAETFIENKNFSGVIVSGKKFLQEKIQQYETLFSEARRSGLKNEVDCTEIENTEDMNFALTTFKPDFIKDPDESVFNQAAFDFVKMAEVTVEFSPFLKDDRKETWENKYRFIRKLVDAGIKVKICTDSMLFMCRSLSDFAADLCNSGLFTQEDVIRLFIFE